MWGSRTEMYNFTCIDVVIIPYKLARAEYTNVRKVSEGAGSCWREATYAGKKPCAIACCRKVQ